MWRLRKTHRLRVAYLRVSVSPCLRVPPVPVVGSTGLSLILCAILLKNSQLVSANFQKHFDRVNDRTHGTANEQRA